MTSEMSSEPEREKKSIIITIRLSLDQLCDDKIRTVSQ